MPAAARAAVAARLGATRATRVGSVAARTRTSRARAARPSARARSGSFIALSIWLASDAGLGFVLLADLGSQLDLPAVQAVIKSRLAGLRREILRQNPVFHNSWRTFGAWLERFPEAKPEELAALWAEYQQERKLADELRREVEAAMNVVVPAAK